jgi:hypothetical protein
MLSKAKLPLTSYLNAACHSSEDHVVSFLEHFAAVKPKSCSASSALAMHIIYDLYSETSADEANINRITTNLEAAADDILAIAKLIRAIK